MVEVGYITDQLWVIAMLALIATAVTVSTAGIRASVTTIAPTTMLSTVHDTWLVQLLPM